MRIRYVVPRVGGIGGIQQFAASQLPWLGGDVTVELEDWTAPRGLSRVVHALGAGRRRSAPAGDVELTHYWHARAALGRVDRPYLITAHGSEIMLAGLPRWERPLVRRALVSAAAVVANSGFTRDYLLAHYPLAPERVHVVHPGVAPSAAGRVRGTSGQLRIGTLSRLVPRKNIARVVEALRLLRDEHGLDVVYRLAGDGPEREAILAELARSGVPHEYLGSISDADKAASFYPGLDVFVLPALASASDVEGFGIVYLEANAAGVPVVAARTGGVADAVRSGGSGEFADPHDPGDIARALSTVLADRERYSAQALGWAAEHTEQASAARLRAVYEQVLLTHPVARRDRAGG